MKLPRELRRAAIAAFEAGQPWTSFMQEHGEEMRRAEPYDQHRYHRLRARLLHIVVSGTESGQFGVGDDDAIEPWERDDAAQTKPDDSHTSARFSPAAAGLAPMQVDVSRQVYPL